MKYREMKNKDFYYCGKTFSQLIEKAEKTYGNFADRVVYYDDTIQKLSDIKREYEKVVLKHEVYIKKIIPDHADYPFLRYTVSDNRHRNILIIKDSGGIELNNYGEQIETWIHDLQREIIRLEEEAEIMKGFANNS